jgi:hypothetical protein
MLMEIGVVIVCGILLVAFVVLFLLAAGSA